MPGLSLPLATDDTGMQIGLQFMTRTNDEATLLSLGRQLELAVPWADRTPLSVVADGATCGPDGC